MPERLEELLAELRRQGLVYRGGFHPKPEDGVPTCAGHPGRTLVLVGNAGSSLWSQFCAWREGGRSVSDPLDRWSVEVLTDIASRVGAQALFPFRGPPYWPFIRWAERAETLWPSPIGLLLHPKYGLWHAYRGAFVFSQRLALPSSESRGAGHGAAPGLESGPVSPCLSCVDQPCLSACPVGAMSDGVYALDSCITHLAGSTPRAAREGERIDREWERNACMSGGCLARRACPVGVQHTYLPAHAQFHMSAFLRSQLTRR